jgi:hypothetical protein
MVHVFIHLLAGSGLNDGLASRARVRQGDALLCHFIGAGDGGAASFASMRKPAAGSSSLIPGLGE